jgi:hypothetical protein
VTRPRAADDFATIHARLAELRREREQAAKSADPKNDPRLDDRGLLNVPAVRQRPDKNDWPIAPAGRRYVSGRQR